jgi:predicted RNase H-like HicB family nuclease
LKYTVVFEKTPSNYAAYVPDLPGCVSTGHTLEEAERNIREAMKMHLASMREHDEPAPNPTARAMYVDVD